MKRHEKIRDIIHLAKQRLDNINHAAHSPSYIKILYLLIVQGLLKVKLHIKAAIMFFAHKVWLDQKVHAILVYLRNYDLSHLNLYYPL